MTNQEAFDRATIIHDTLTTGKDLTIKFNSKNVEWIIKAAEALEKQIPKSVEAIPQDDEGIYMQYICPNCERHLSYGNPTPFDKPHHCRCGQAIDWSEVEE